MKRFLAVAVLLMLPSAAFAQGNQGPFAGLFGRTPDRVGRDYTLFELRSAATLQLDDQAINSVGDQIAGTAGIASLNGGATFDRQTTRLRTTMRGLAIYNEFLQTPRLGATTIDAGGLVTWRIGTRFSLDGSATYRHSPYFQFFPSLAPAPYVPGVVTPISPYIAGLIESDSVDASVGFTSYYSKRSTLSVSASRRQTSFRDARAADFEMDGVRGVWTRRMSRDLSLRLGYSREESRTKALDDVEYVYESIEAGLDFNRPVSLSRNTTIAFRTDSSVIARQGEGRHFRLNGGIQLQHWFTRTWRWSVDAIRNTEFLPGFTEPLFSTSVGTTLSGLVSPRTELSVSAIGGQGYFGVTGQQGQFTTASLTTQLSFAVVRNFGVFAQHSFYFYELPRGVSVLPTVNRMSRQMVTAGATVWLPVINRERSPSDSR